MFCLTRLQYFDGSTEDVMPNIRDMATTPALQAVFYQANTQEIETCGSFRLLKEQHTQNQMHPQRQAAVCSLMLATLAYMPFTIHNKYNQFA